MSFIKNIIKRFREKWHSDILNQYQEQLIQCLTKLNYIQNQQIQLVSDFEMFKRSFIDPNGPSSIALRMRNLDILPKYEHCFYEMPENSVCIDCGANQGFFTDLILSLHGYCYAFEPNKALYNLLIQKYRGIENVEVFSEAVSDSEGTVDFKLCSNLNHSYLKYTDGGSISPVYYSSPQIGTPEVYYQVKKIRLVDFLQNTVFQKHNEVYILKMDIEGGEFETLEDIIRSGAYSKIKYLFCETHARFFNDGDKKLHRLESLIHDNNITNIFLDWT